MSNIIYWSIRDPTQISGSSNYHPVPLFSVYAQKNKRLCGSEFLAVPNSMLINIPYDQAREKDFQAASLKDPIKFMICGPLFKRLIIIFQCSIEGIYALDTVKLCE